MRIFPMALITVGVFGLLKHLGYIDPALMHLFWPLLLIGVGLVMLARGPHWRAGLHERMADRWERRMHRRFGPGWAALSEEERERFRAGMRHSSVDGVSASNPKTPSSTAHTAPAKGPGEQH